jgi:hypothetical protein
MYIECAVWIIFIALGVVMFLKKNRKFTNTILAGIYIAGLITLVTGFISASQKTHKGIEINDREMKDVFVFNSKNNVLLILLDTFQSDYFEYISNTFPEETAPFDGFTFFRNTASLYPTTKASLPSIISGSTYLNDQPFDDYIAAAYAKFNLIDAYKKESYNSCLVGLNGTSPNVVSMQHMVDRLCETSVLPIYSYLDYALFRSAPTAIKPFIYNKGIWWLSFLMRKNYPPENFGADIHFLELFEKASNVHDSVGVKGTFKILHFFTPHMPLNVNENLQYDTELSGKEGYLSQARGALKIAGRVLARLQQLAIYDNTEIIVLSDHGTMKFPQSFGTAGQMDSVNGVPPNVRTASHALLLHKPVNSHGKITIDESPLEISDIACMLGIRKDKEACEGYLQARSGASRKRPFYFYNWDDTWESSNIPNMTEYFINGHVYKQESYRKGNFIYTPTGKIAVATEKN